MGSKKEDQLGIHESTARAILLKDILFSLAARLDLIICFQCGGLIERKDFSVEHKIPWLDSLEPRHLFFDLKNIAFSHLKCNVQAKRLKIKYKTDEERKAARRAWKKKYRDSLSVEVRKKLRRDRYLRYGK